MFRLFIPLAFVAVFIAWIIYHYFIAKDLKKQANTLYVGLFFTAIWAVIYFMVSVWTKLI